MNREKSRLRWYHFLFIALAVVVAVATFVSAKYIKRTEEVDNNFTPAVSENPTVIEDFDGKVKENVYFTVGDEGYPVYVRAAIIITWKDENGIIYFLDPEKGIDYLIDLNLSNDDTGWVYIKADENDPYGYYYYQEPVKSGGKTDVLINSCEQIKKCSIDGYTLSVEIIVQTVQAVGFTDGDGVDPSTEIPAYKDAWAAWLSLQEE